ATTAAEHWRERAEDASATAAAIRDDNTALKAEVARLQQMKRTVPATSSVKQASSTTSSTAGWQTAKVSWYGPGFYGNTMAGGGVLTTSSMVVAHRTMAFGTRIEFRYKGRTCIAVVNDRGPFIAGRTFDLGPGTAKALGFSGVGTVEWRVV
ncbi:MAG: septal ring lytic transglycosylase RlpA family protein, partial [Desulfomicrobium apsheronum]|nr:septal ring lytic transglycosylase RlpA family protein [Desulfomicrobium apsheronum]